MAPKTLPTSSNSKSREMATKELAVGIRTVAKPKFWEKSKLVFLGMLSPAPSETFALLPMAGVKTDRLGAIKGKFFGELTKFGA